MILRIQAYIFLFGSEESPAPILYSTILSDRARVFLIVQKVESFTLVTEMVLHYACVSCSCFRTSLGTASRNFTDCMYSVRDGERCSRHTNQLMNSSPDSNKVSLYLSSDLYLLG